MPNYFPCPNAQCNYQFDADILPAAAMVTCPYCRTKFPYRAQPAPDAEIPAASEPAPTGPRVVQLRNAPHRGGILTTIMWAGGFSVVLIALLFAVYMWNKKSPFVNTNVNETKWNFSIDLPKGWEEDIKVRSSMNINIFVKKKNDADQWVAMFAKDYVDRTPRPGEIREELLARFKVERDDPDNPRPFKNMSRVELADTQWLKQPAVAFEFTADLDEMPIRGECHAVTYKGILYAFYIFAIDKDWDASKADLVAFRNLIRLGSARDNWTEKRTSSIIHTVEGSPYSLEDVDGVWKRASEEGDPRKDYVVDPKDIDTAATMAFIVRQRINARKDTRQHTADAKALVVALPKAEDPLEAAKAHVIERLKKDYAGTPPALKFEPLAKSPAGITLPTGGPAMARLLLRDPTDQDNVTMWILAALNIGNQTIAVEISASERYATQLEEWMVHLAGSLKAK